MIPRPPTATRTDTLFPSTTLRRSLAEHAQQFRMTGNLGHELMKAFIQLQEMLDRRALLRLDAVIGIDVHGSEPFIGRPLAGELHNGDLEPEPSLVKIENLQIGRAHV